MEKKQKLPILSVVQSGSEQFERFLIKDEQERVWTGKRFGSDGGALYADQNQALSDTHDILRQSFKGVDPQRLVVPVYVDVLNHSGPVPLAEVAQYLSAASKLFIDTPTYGNGPGESLVLARIEWSRIERSKEVPQ